jgi:GNAT superfamily N-acetyltransferase
VPDVEIRDATMADLGMVRAVYRRSSLSNDGDRANLLAHPDVLVLSDRAIREGRTRVAVTEDGEILGFVVLETLGGALELDKLFVDPDFMRRGVGSQLVADTVRIAQGRGVPRVEVTANPHALSFYVNAGFALDGPIETRFGVGQRMHRNV